MAESRVLLTGEQIAGALDAMAERIAAATPAEARLALVGIRSRGEVLAGRLIAGLKTRRKGTVPLGVLDITLYRDDLALKGGKARVRQTQIDFDVDDALIVLVDDVLYTGRTVRAALDALVDLGRPRAIRLAALIDRGGRELPIQPDYVGVRLDEPVEHVKVRLVEPDGADRVEVQ